MEDIVDDDVMMRKMTMILMMRTRMGTRMMMTLMLMILLMRTRMMITLMLMIG